MNDKVIFYVYVSVMRIYNQGLLISIARTWLTSALYVLCTVVSPNLQTQNSDNLYSKISLQIPF